MLISPREAMNAEAAATETLLCSDDSDFYD